LPFNPAAPPFEPPKKTDSYPTIIIGPSQLPVNGKIWESIANNRVHPTLPRAAFSPQYQIPVKIQPVLPLQPSPAFYSQNNIFAGYVSASNQILPCHSHIFHFLVFRIIRLNSKTITRATWCSLVTLVQLLIPTAMLNFACAKASRKSS
jgi:hypothetical protein